MFTKTLFFFFVAAFCVQQNGATSINSTITELLDQIDKFVDNVEEAAQNASTAVEDNNAILTSAKRHSAEILLFLLKPYQDLIDKALINKNNSDTCLKILAADIRLLALLAPAIATDCVNDKIEEAENLMDLARNLTETAIDIKNNFFKNMDIECSQSGGVINTTKRLLCKGKYTARVAATVADLVYEGVKLVGKVNVIIVFVSNMPTSVSPCVTYRIGAEVTKIFTNFSFCSAKAIFG